MLGFLSQIKAGKFNRVFELHHCINLGYLFFDGFRAGFDTGEEAAF